MFNALVEDSRFEIKPQYKEALLNRLKKYDRDANNLKEAFAACGFEVSLDEQGGIDSLIQVSALNGSLNGGFITELFGEIAQYVKPGSFIEFSGDYVFKVEFDGKTAEEVFGLHNAVYF